MPIRLAAFNSTVISTTGMMIITPPMVGVPILMKCLSGSSTRICLPILKWRRIRSSGPPQMTVIMKTNPARLMARVVSFMKEPPGR